MATKDTSYIEKERASIGEKGTQTKQGAPAGYNSDNFEPMGKKGDKSVTSGEAFKNSNKSNVGDGLEAPMGKKGSGGYNKTLPENGVFSDDGFTPMGKKGAGGA